MGNLVAHLTEALDEFSEGFSSPLRTARKSLIVRGQLYMPLKLAMNGSRSSLHLEMESFGRFINQARGASWSAMGNQLAMTLSSAPAAQTASA